MEVETLIAVSQWRDHVGYDTAARWRAEWRMRRWDDARDSHHKYQPWVMERRYVHDHECDECSHHQGEWETYLLGDGPDTLIAAAIGETAYTEAISVDSRHVAAVARWRVRSRWMASARRLEAWIGREKGRVARDGNRAFREATCRLRRQDRIDAIRATMLAEWQPKVAAHAALVARVERKYQDLMREV